ncbi:MAG: AbrB/MazE/SpoVT family DNA-binding domain-containing protein [Pseudomonadota bacterium]|nr:MAG: AbrB/MazE/SpoVT family DNA-binding domain-containing protein [Pseudomonadota bacterium]
MDTVKIGKKGQVSIPRRVLEAAGVEAGSQVVVESDSDGSIRLRPVAIYPIEIYSEERIDEFERENELSDDLERRVRQATKDSR